ncbi:hypothetical protein [Halodurantibacterium flavum]|uniref:Flagellar assembly protein FliH n=1 Tax=Halodurantibacterium flavum TaxID=1382802 RepID=A0ABW4S8T1_9RHOB
MNARPQLRNFDLADTPPDPPSFSAQEVEAARTEGYAEGHAAGRREAEEEYHQRQDRLTEELSSHLQELSFGYHEALNHILAALEPLFAEITGTLLPEAARAVLPLTLNAALSDLAAEVAKGPLTLELCATDRPAVEKILDGSALPVRLQELADLAPGQFRICKPDGGGTAIDMPAVVEALGQAVTDFFTLTKERKLYG